MDEIKALLSEMSVIDFVDIALVSLIIYYVYSFIKSRGVYKLAVGVVILILLQIISEAANLSAMGFILQNVFQVGTIALIIIFQPELRSALEKVGNEPIRNIRIIKHDASKYPAMLDQICAAIADMSANKVGSLIVIERDQANDHLYSNGTLLNSDVTRNLLNTIFFKMTPLHDGAVVIRNFKIHSAACCLPLSTTENGQEAAHTRHLAALGMSERSDAVVIVTSEESGRISLAIDGRFEKFANAQALKARLTEIFVGSVQNEKSRGRDKKKNVK